MKRNRTSLLLALLALINGSCSAPPNSVVNSLSPIITGFSPDTAWTFKNLIISGKNFSYDASNCLVSIDTLRTELRDLEDTTVTVLVPENAHTGFVHVWSYESTATSSKPVVVMYSFSPHGFVDTAAPGGFFSIPGTGMNNFPSTLRVFLNATEVPVDSVYSNRIVCHLFLNSYSGTVTLTDSSGHYYNTGSLVVTRPSYWRTLSEIWDNLTLRETHHLTGPGIDSSWYTTASYSGQRDIDIAGLPFIRTAQGISLTLISPFPYTSNFQEVKMNWDTVHQTASFSYTGQSGLTNLDTIWSASNSGIPAPLPVEGNIELTAPNYAYEIQESSMDSTNVGTRSEVTVTSILTGSFDLIFKH